MNWLGRLVVRTLGMENAPEPPVPVAAPAPEPEPPPAPLMRCPDCEGLDFTRICTLVGLRAMVPVERGARYCCEDCASIWSVSPSGVRRANPRSLPVVMQPPKPRPEGAGAPPPAQAIREDMPIPKARPRV